MPFSDVASIHGDPTTPRPVDCRTSTTTRLDDELMATVVDQARSGLPFLVEVRALGGALSRTPAVASCVGQRAAAANVYTTAYDATTPSVGSMQERFLDGLGDSRAGALPNFLLGSQVTGDDVRRCFDPASWQRLRELKAAVDPTSMFRYHQHDALASPA
jgi:hypothetical protein